uniref:Uncharacterized protein n=1 Tax=Oryza meridionalis TaxID=40149 RepID=A0A0E0F598_9ORYZ
MSRRSTLLQMLLDEKSLSDGDEEFIFSAADIVHGEFDDDEVPKHGGSVLGHIYEKIQDKKVHNQLREDLIEHLWNHHAYRY